LTYAVTYLKQVAAITVGADTDASLPWPTNLDRFWCLITQLGIAHELSNNDLLQRVVVLLDIEKAIVEQKYGISLSALKLPPLRDLQQIVVRST
jgi:hypothetical protein